MLNYLQEKSYKDNSCQYCKLSTLCLPKDFNKSELNAISKLINNNYALAAGECLCVSGEKFRFLYAIQSGSAKDSTISINGNEQVADFYLPGEIVGLDAISTGKHAFDTITLESSIICIIPFDNLLILAEKIPNLHHRLMHLTSQKLLQRTRIMINNHYTAEQRIATFLMNMADRYKCKGLSPKTYSLSMSRCEIGSYLNLTAETVSRIFTRFQNEGIIIAHKKHIQLVNLSKLVTRSCLNN